MTRISLCLSAGVAFLLSADNPAFARPVDDGRVVPRLTTTPTFVASTVPPNLDVNPYGVAFVPEGFPPGKLNAGDILVSNFNNSSNQQGTGTTIVQIPKTDRTSSSLFFENSATPGLSTALGVLRGGFVLVGNVPSTNTTMPGVCKHLDTDVGAGALTVIAADGTVTTLTDGIDGPWDLTIKDEDTTAKVFVSNARSGTVVRLDLTLGTSSVSVDSVTQIASGYGHDCNDAAFVVAPTGLALDQNNADILYVASTEDNTIFAIDQASTRLGEMALSTGRAVVLGKTAARYLHGPLGLTLAPNGDLISAQGDAINPRKNEASEISEFTPEGVFVAQLSITPKMAGSAFGVAISREINAFTFAAVNDGDNTLETWDVQQ